MVDISGPTGPTRKMHKTRKLRTVKFCSPNMRADGIDAEFTLVIAPNARSGQTRRGRARTWVIFIFY